MVVGVSDTLLKTCSYSSPISFRNAKGFLPRQGSRISHESRQFWGVAKGSPVSWVAKLQGDKNSGWSRSYREIKLLLSAGNEWSQSYRVTNQRPNLPWNFMTVSHGFLDPSALVDMDFWTPMRLFNNVEFCVKRASESFCAKRASESFLRESAISGTVCTSPVFL